MCRLVWTMAIVTIVIGGTNGDYSASSWGDPHITTVDKVEYDFNGHGEYTFLQKENTTVQVRADYVTPGNKDSTIFVAVAIKDDIGQLEAQLNRTSGVVTVYKAGMAVCSSNDSLPQGTTSIPCGFSSTPPRPVRGVIVGTGKVLFSLKGFGSYMKTITLQGGSEISITLDGIKDSILQANLIGLAGGSVNGSMVASNGSLYNALKPVDMFAFGESWRVSQNESLFNYSLSQGNYLTYNNVSRPTFYEDFLTDLTVLFNQPGHNHNATDIDNFNKTCNETEVREECLLAIARSDNIMAGEIVINNYRHEQYLYELRHNTPPYFTDEIPDLDVYLADNHSVILNLSKYFHDNNTEDILTFLVETNLPKTHFTLDRISGLFNWTILPSLRDLNDSIQITFTVHDRFNGTVVRDVEVNFCGCNKTSQCDKQHSDKCSCQGDKYVTGDYCEIRRSPCTVTTCFNQSLCNGDNITDKTGPCAPCPKGRYSDFQSDKQICHDEDECDSKYDGADKCDVNSNCTNTDGSYTCTCHHGYRRMSNGYQCEDIDECKKGATCGINEVCRNIKGNYTCDCIGGYGRKQGTACSKIEGVSYVLSATWQIEQVDGTTPPDSQINRDVLLTYLKDCLGNISGFLSIEIVSITVKTINTTGNANSNRQRRSPDIQQLSVVYILHLNNTMEKNTLRASVANHLTSTTPNMTNIILQPGIQDTNIEQDGLCSLTKRTDCDPVSTNCKDSNGTYECVCKHGYERPDQTIKNLCYDVNECQNSTYFNRCTTHGGVCQNLQGSWNCTCPHDTIWMDVGTEDAPLYRCQRNHTYVGHVTFISFFNISDKNITELVTTKINVALSDNKNNASTDPPLSVREVFVYSTVLNINRIRNVHAIEYDAMFALRFGLPVSPMMLHDILASLTDLSSYVYNTNFTVFNESENKLCEFFNECVSQSTKCLTKSGTVVCECRTGFVSSASPNNCIDIDECKQNTGACQHGRCENIPGSWICHCPQGYNTTIQHNSTICQDIDECEDPNRCPHGPCNNTIGSYICDCTEGYYGNDDNTTCHDINECIDQTLCVNGTCNNTEGSWHCECHNGFKHTDANNQSCKDIDECYITNTCNHGNCTNTIGSYYCDCHDGFGYDGNDNTNCVDINECTNQTLCDDGTCINTNGSWHCDCNNGFTHTDLKNQSCEDIDECTNYTNACIGDISPFNPCVNLKGSWTCNCDSGHSVDLNVTSKLCSGVFRYLAYLHIYTIDNTNANNLLQMFIQREIWSYYVQKFPYDGVKVASLNIITDMLGTNATFVLNFDLPRSREDIEKVWTTFKKDTCTSFVCQFNGTNFVITTGNLTSEGKNTGICRIQNMCDAVSTDCISNNGQTTFECKSGFHKSSESSSCCEDINECEQKSDSCLNETCENIPGSWICHCPLGYENTTSLSNSTICQDINECVDPNRCPQGTCNNTIGSYICVCNEGYHRNDDNTTCHDINECANQPLCDYGDCKNTNGSWQCDCHVGFYHTDLKNQTCVDINECTKQTLCDNGTCINTNGSWHCDCHNGFKHTDSKNQSCEGAKQTVQVIQSSFTFTVSASTNETEVNSTLSKMIRESYESQYNRSDITVIILTIMPQSGRSIRSAENPNVTHFTCKYEVHFTTPAAVKPENNTLTAYLNEHKNSPAYRGIQLQAEDPVVFHEAVSILGGNTVATSTSTTMSTTTAASNPTTSKTTDENAKDLTTILIGTGSTLGGLVVILTVVVGCVCWRKRQPEKTKLDSLPEHITMDTFGPGHDFKPVNPAYSSSHHLNQSVMYDHFQGVPGSSNQSPYRHSREELSNSYNHAFHHQNRESLYRTSSLPGLPRIENGAVKVLPSGEPQRPPSPIPDYHDPDVRGHGRNPPSPKPDYMPHHEHNFESKRSYPIQNGIHGHVVRNGVSVLPMARPRSMDNLAPNYNHLPSGPIYSQPHKQRRGSFGNY